jgi:Tfp pilus assembly protein PilN
MIQQINLLTDDLRRKREPLTLSQLLMIWGVFGGLLVVFSGWDGVGLWQLNSEHERTEEQRRMLSEANEALKSHYATDPTLKAEVETLRAQQLEQQQLMSLLLGYQSEQDDGFSLYLDDLSTQAVDGMWLSQISLLEGGSRIQLKGITDDPVNLPVFLKRLSDGQSFKGHRFDEFELKEAESGLLEFDITGPHEVPG